MKRLLDCPELLGRRGVLVVHPDKALLSSGRTAWRRGVWVPSGPKRDEGMVLWDLSYGTLPRVQERVYAGRLLVDDAIAEHKGARLGHG